jgi:hypothetical protein
MTGEKIQLGDLDNSQNVILTSRYDYNGDRKLRKPLVTGIGGSGDVTKTLYACVKLVAPSG